MAKILSAKPKLAQPTVVQPKTPKAPKASLWTRMGSNYVLLISIAVHLLFGGVATYIVVQNIGAKRKMTFAGGPPTTNPSKRALEHQVAMGKKKNMMSAPAQAKRITTTGLAKVALPDMPTMPAMTDVMPTRIAGMGGMGFGPGGGGGGGLGTGGGGSGINFFGLRARMKSVLFLVDISGSMVQGQGKGPGTWQMLEDEIDRALKGVEPTTRFGVVAFSRGIEAYKSDLTDARNDEKSNAIKWLKKHNPSVYIDPTADPKAKAKHEGTRADLALQKAFRMKPEVVFFVSDGEPTDVNTDGLLKQVETAQKTLSRPLVINVVAYKATGGESFMRALAEKNNGVYKEVN